MKRNLTLISLTVLVTAAAVFLIGLACSWDILTRGEIHDEETATLEDLQIEQLETLEDPPDTLPVIIEDPPQLEILRDIPDTVAVMFTGTVVYDGETCDFIEMEVGELLQGQGGERDTIFIDNRP